MIVLSRSLILALLVMIPLPLSRAFYHDHHAACALAANPEICIASMEALDLDPGNAGSFALAAVGSARDSLEALLASTAELDHGAVSSSKPSRSMRKRAVMRDCVELLHDASRLAADSQVAIGRMKASDLVNAHTWMSAALTYHTTCLDGLIEAGFDEHKLLNKARESLSTCLAAIASLRKNQEQEPQIIKTPHWVSKSVGNYTILPNITVAKDGSGQFENITAALAAAPTKSSSRFVIYIKQGTYLETFEVPRNLLNLMFLGDGIGKTIITGNKSVQDPNITTFTSATVAIRANNFIAQDITFQNTAGAINHQAVAVRVTADKVAFFRCSFEGFQDTLYAHSLRQFYTQCEIYGTVDYIFGNAAAIFQNCNLYARLPMPKQKNTYTAQGRTDPNQNTGFSFQNCAVDGTPELKANITQFPTFLGRPWKEYAVTVFLKCYESAVVDPAGWLEWSGDFALQTLFYGEYFCYGPGGSTVKRVDWSTQIFDSSFASKYTAMSLVNGDEWLPTTNLPYTLVL
ncbi:pectinesterase [Selaginella moellendorffii]|nr:pectinesterase [Selaginella moellendorffii]|eukprot:XP_002990830.2 pectinesterase [Selaginella moellendorffii]